MIRMEGWRGIFIRGAGCPKMGPLATPSCCLLPPVPTALSRRLLAAPSSSLWPPFGLPLDNCYLLVSWLYMTAVRTAVWQLSNSGLSPIRQPFLDRPLKLGLRLDIGLTHGAISSPLIRPLWHLTLTFQVALLHLTDFDFDFLEFLHRSTFHHSSWWTWSHSKKKRWFWWFKLTKLLCSFWLLLWLWLLVWLTKLVYVRLVYCQPHRVQ